MTDQPGTTPLRRSMQEADERIAAAERECDQLRALLRQVRNLIRIFDINMALALIDSSGLVEEE